MLSLETANYVLSLGTLLLQIVTLKLLVLSIFRNKFARFEAVYLFLATYGLWIGFLFSLLASLLTLYYSEILGLPPCPLCWWQRIFLYPQVVLFAVALIKRDRTISCTSIALSILGLGVALYHHALQILPSGTLPCPAEGTVSCAQRFVFEFGYITFPLMAATLFAFLIVLMLFVRSSAKKTSI